MIIFLLALAALFYLVGFILGISVLAGGTDKIDTIIGISSIVVGIVIGTMFSFCAEILNNSESQTALLRDIKKHFFPE